MSIEIYRAACGISAPLADAKALLAAIDDDAHAAQRVLDELGKNQPLAPADRVVITAAMVALLREQRAATPADGATLPLGAITAMQCAGSSFTDGLLREYVRLRLDQLTGAGLDVWKGIASDAAFANAAVTAQRPDLLWFSVCCGCPTAAVASLSSDDKRALASLEAVASDRGLVSGHLSLGPLTQLLCAARGLRSAPNNVHLLVAVRASDHPHDVLRALYRVRRTLITRFVSAVFDTVVLFRFACQELLDFMLVNADLRPWMVGVMLARASTFACQLRALTESHTYMMSVAPAERAQWEPQMSLSTACAQFAAADRGLAASAGQSVAALAHAAPADTAAQALADLATAAIERLADIVVAGAATA